MPNKTSYILVLAFLVVYCFGQNIKPECLGAECAIDSNGKLNQNLTFSQKVEAIDKEVRRVYWYYLREATQIFQTNMNIPNKETLHFYIYRNVLGTFLAIVSHEKQKGTLTINTFARLGSGFSRDANGKNDTIVIQPFIISLKLNSGELVAELDKDGNLIIDGKPVKTETKPGTASEQPLPQIDTKTNTIDAYVRKNYWYYVDKASLIGASNIVTSERVYVVLTYVNISGTYVVMGSIDANDKVQIHTFLRIGSGSDADNQQPIKLQPQLILAN